MTIAETIMRHQRLADAATEWLRSRSEFGHAVTSSAYNGQEVGAARERHDRAAAGLAEAIERIQDDQLAVLPYGDSGAARRVTRLEGEIVLAAISWMHASGKFDGEGDINAAQVAMSRLDECENDLACRVRDLLETLAEAAAA